MLNDLNVQIVLFRGMQSKRIARLEHQLSVNIHNTQHRIWTGVTKDLSFLRHILNEVNLMKFKVILRCRLKSKPFHATFLYNSQCIQIRLKKRSIIHSVELHPVQSYQYINKSGRQDFVENVHIRRIVLNYMARLL